MNTMLDTREVAVPGADEPASSLSPATTWDTISAVDRFLVSPAWPVAQNGQPIPHPAWDDTHIVTRSGYFISTDSTSAPSNSRHSHLRVAPSSHDSASSADSSEGSSSPASAVRSAAGRSVMSAGLSVYLAK
jgi:hypothetical protein